MSARKGRHGAKDIPGTANAARHRYRNAPRIPDHPAIKAQNRRLLANLGTPDNYDYWSMRRYLNEFLSDRRVIDYSARGNGSRCCNL